MLAVIVVRCSGWLIAEIPNGRKSGQWMIATSIGLHFTQPVAQEIFSHFPLMLAAAVLTLLLALAGIAVMRHQGMTLTTAYFAFMPANFAEMIQLGARYRADVSQIAAAHSIRLVLIVLSVPPAMFLLMHLAPDAVVAIRPPADWHWLGPLLAGGVLVALLWKRLGLPNPWMFGPMTLCATLTACFDLRTALPVELSQYGQLMIGCALGSFFRPRILSPLAALPAQGGGVHPVHDRRYLGVCLGVRCALGLCDPDPGAGHDARQQYGNVPHG